MKVRRGKFSGAIGNEVYVSTRQGQVVRSRPRRRLRDTADRVRAQDNLGRVARLWRTLTDQEFAEWGAAAAKEKMNPYRFFCMINGALAAYGQPVVRRPPRRERLQPNPVEALDIQNRAGEATLRLRVPRAPAELTFVFGVRWCSRGISAPRSNGVLLGRLPAAVGGWSEITDLYVKKFGRPPAGWRVFIWTLQLVNGRTDARKMTRADVPPPAGKQGRAPRAPAGQ